MKNKQQFRIKIAFPLVYLKQISQEAVLEAKNVALSLRDQWQNFSRFTSSGI